MDFSCPVCQDIFKDPVVLSCSHSFCKACLQRWWTEKQIHECPLCKRRSSKGDPPRNLALKNLCEAFLQELSLEEKSLARSEDLCSQHSEKLKLFCLDHQQPACVICRDSKTHANHKFSPIDEAAQDFKAKLKTSLKPLQDKLECLNQVKVNWEQIAEYINVQVLNTETQIKEEFKKLHCFLQKEEQARIAALRTEEGRKTWKMRWTIGALNREISALSDTIRAIEQDLKAGDISFLQNYKVAAERVQHCTLFYDTKLESGALLDMAKHLGNLTFNVWNQMKEMVTYSPVILDPNTANPNLILAKNLTSVRHAEPETEREVPRNPERFEDYITVLGSEGFDSGTHSWEVEVRNETSWAVGVTEESVPRRGEILSGYWEIWFRDGKYSAYSPPVVDRVLSVKKPIGRIQVNLDWSKGKLTFIDPDTNTTIYTFSHTFTQRLFPFINTLNTMPLSISPMKVTAQLE